MKSLRESVRKVHEEMKLNNNVIKSFWGYVKHLEKNPLVDLSTKGARPRGRPPGTGNARKRKAQTQDEDGDYASSRSTRRR